MPRYEPRLGKVMNVAEFVTRHARVTTGDDYPMETPENLALSMYLAHQSNGEPFAVDVVSPGAKEAAERGKKLIESGKIGQLLTTWATSEGQLCRITRHRAKKRRPEGRRVICDTTSHVS